VPARWEHDAIYAAVQGIPVGVVATYGQIAELAGLPRRWRLVGRALGALPADSAVPWHRVVNAKGEISPRGTGDSEREQRLLLEDEGVTFDVRGRIDLARHRWAE
jgi:methylated-DNA-protein-cysteine methyltransferase related protein